MNAALMTDCRLHEVSAAIEVDPLPPERLLGGASDVSAAFIDPDGSAWVGLGAARWLEPGATQAGQLWGGLLDESPEAPPPAALGALPFDPAEVPDALWRGLMPAGLMLPRQLYVLQEGRAWWRLTVPVDEAGSLRWRLKQVRQRWAQQPPVEAGPLPACTGCEDGVGPGCEPQRYAQAVDEAVARIRGGELVKVVLARRSGVDFAAAPHPAALLARLGARHPDCVRYAWCVGGKAWLGATPETLVQVQGRRLRTLALAGTRSAALAHELLDSVKDQHEHAIVVAAIRQALAPLASALPLPSDPEVRHLRGLAHLQTPIEASLRDGVDCLQLVRALHPTPAVCGLPTERAAAVLAELEAAPRGLYAGPFVRLAPDGSGHAVVSLRGAVLDGRRAVLPAGAGIVAGSDAAAELAETQVKQRSVLDAFRCKA